MAGLGETTARLKRLRSAAAKPAPTPPRALLVETAFAPNPGNLRMLSSAPAKRSQPAMVVVLHGCTQTAESFQQGAGWAELSQRHGFVLLCPEQRSSNNPNGCFNWFDPSHIRRGEGEAASIRHMIERAAAIHGVDRSKIYIAGFSAGAAMAVATLAAYPEVFAGGAIIAGLPYGAAENMQEAFGAMMHAHPRSPAKWAMALHAAGGHAHGDWPDISIWTGSADSMVNPANAGELVKQWRHAHGLDEARAETSRVGPCGREVWRDAHGRARVSAYVIAGLGHGAAVDCGGEPSCGQAGPFLFDLGFSCAAQIASDWGLAPARDHPQTVDAAPVAAPEWSLANEIDAAIRGAFTAAGLLK